MIHAFFSYLATHMHDLIFRLAQHIYISLSATIAAIIIGVPAGVWIYHQKKAQASVLAIANIFQTIPSLALLAFLVPMIGIGFYPTIITLTIYALLPIIRNTYSGINDIPNYTIDAADALGFTTWQKLRLVELPLAMPIILSGVRIATAITIGITTIAAFIGAGGLGDFITTGLAMGDNRLVLLGAIPTALLALALDFVIGNIEAKANPYQRNQNHRYRYIFSVIIVILVIITLGYPLYKKWAATASSGTITIASKNFSESYILANIMSDLIEAHTKLNVNKVFNLETTSVIHNAMLNGDVDLYAEYTGTAYMIVLKQTKLTTPEKTLQMVRSNYAKQFNFTVLPKFGFSNSESLAVTDQFAKQHKLKTLSDLAAISSNYIIGAPPEFLERADGFKALSKVYHFTFKKILQMEISLMYKAIANNSVQIIEVFTTDGRIREYKLTPMIDNKHAYPPYDAVPIIRSATLKQYPQVGKALKLIEGKINQNTIIHLNYLVDVKKESPEKVAKDFLKERHLL